MSSNSSSPSFSRKIKAALDDFQQKREEAAEKPGGAFAVEPVNKTKYDTGEDKVAPPAYDPYVAPGMKLAAAWSWRGLVVLAAAAVALHLLGMVRVILLPALIAILITALLAPFVAFLMRKGWPRAGAAATVFLSFLLLLAGLVALTGQQLVVGFADLKDQFVLGVQSIIEWLQSDPFGIDSSQFSAILDDGLNSILSLLENQGGKILGGAVGAASSVTSFLTGLVLTLFTAYFFVYDGNRIFTWFVGLLPKRARPRTEKALLRGWNSIMQYVRVQIIVAAVDATGIGLGALFIGIPLVFPLTVLVFMGSFIPIVGAVLTGAIAVVVALVSQGFVAALIMLAVVLVVQQIEGNVLQPFIMGKAVSVHPLAVVLSVTAGGFLFGIPGALFAVPTIAFFNTVILSLAGRDPLAPPDPEVAKAEKKAAKADAAAAKRAARSAGTVSTGTSVAPEVSTTDAVDVADGVPTEVIPTEERPDAGPAAGEDTSRS